MRDKVEEVLKQIRPTLELHGGSVELVRIIESEGIAEVRFEGACKGCPFSHMTLKMVVEASIIEHVPEIKQVIAV